jgi:hypothetical protein
MRRFLFSALVGAASLLPAASIAGTIAMLGVPKPPGICVMQAPPGVCAPTVWVDTRDATRYRLVVQANALPNPPANLVLMYEGPNGGGCFGDRCVTLTIQNTSPPHFGGAPLYATPIVYIPESQRAMNVRVWLAMRDNTSVMPSFNWAEPVLQLYRQ